MIKILSIFGFDFNENLMIYTVSKQFSTVKCIFQLPSLISHTIEYQDYGRLIANVAPKFHLSLYPHPCNMTLQLFLGFWVGFYDALADGMQLK